MYVSIDVYPTQTSLPNNILPELTYMIPFSDLYMCMVYCEGGHNIIHWNACVYITYMATIVLMHTLIHAVRYVIPLLRQCYVMHFTNCLVALHRHI